MSLTLEKEKTGTSSQKKTDHSAPQAPVLQVTRFDQISAWLIALVVAVSLVAAWEIAVHFINRPPRQDISKELILLEPSGGSEDGSPDETLLLESPDPEVPDPSLAEVESEEIQVEELLDTVIEMSDTAAEQTNKQLDVATQNSGNPGSASGTGRRALGNGPGEGGLSRDQRWFIRYSEKQTLEQYARQLDYFGIVFGTIQGREMVYVSDFSKPKPTVKRVKSTKDEQRLYMTWQGGTRSKEDIKLFQKAGISVSGMRIFQFIPPKLENELAHLELDYRNREVQQIRRTYFTVNSVGSGYKFVVTRQLYFR